jgi:cobalamin biosynthesis protein CobD/CbiB
MSKIEKWFKGNWFIVFFAVVTTLIAWFLKDAIMTSDGMLQSLVQAQATILSLFGIIVAYLLTSYDSRLDRLEQQSFDVERVPLDDRDHELSSFLIKRFKEIKKQKSKTAQGILWVGSALVFSLLLSVIAFGLRDVSGWENLKAEVSMVDIVLFFCGILGIFLMFNRMGKEPEEPKSE